MVWEAIRDYGIGAVGAENTVGSIDQNETGKWKRKFLNAPQYTKIKQRA